jgi:hypothetical protein
MADPHTTRALLQGAFDTHIHSAPDVLPRKFDDLQLAARMRQVGMAGGVLKSHYTGTAERASLVRQSYPDVRLFGMLVLNNSVGGLNPVAVDIAGRLGAKVVSLPTVNAANELENISGQRDESKLPYWMGIARAMQARGIAGDWIRVVDEQGRVSEAARQCFEVVASYDMLLATGHIAPHEMLPTIVAAKEAGVQRLLITHPEFPTTRLDIEQQRELARQGVYFERCFTTPHTGKIPWEVVFDNIRQLGTESTILATDLGQSTAPWPDEGLELYMAKLLDVGFTEHEVQRMVRDNPAQLLGVTTTAGRQEALA